MDSMEMKVNRLPAPTWNWLRMNGTETAARVGGEGAFDFEIPAGVAGETLSAPSLDCASGMGPDVERLVKDAALPVRKYTAVGKVDEALRFGFDYADGAAAFNAVELETGEGGALTAVMDFRSAPGAAGFAGVQTKMALGRNSLLRLVQIQRLGGALTFFNDVGARCADGARVELIQLALGGGSVFMGAQCALEGRGSALKADIGYLLRGTERLDMNYTALHEGRRTQSGINASGVLRDKAFKLFRGTIDFRRGAAQASGSEKEDVLLMDDGVVNRTIPLILCGEDDVEGDHGATVGRLDDRLLFYLESRGLNREDAYEMMARARVVAVAARIPDERTRRGVERWLNGGADDE